MHPLTDRDYRSALQIVADVCSERDLRGFQQSVVSRLADLIPSDVVSFNLVGPSGLLAVDEPAGTCTPALRAVLPPLLKEHPMLPYGLLRGDTRPYRLSDFRSERQFAATALYAEFYAKIGLRHELSFTVRCAPDTSLTVGLNRKRTDYGDRELELLRLVAPHIIAAHRRLWELAEPSTGETMKGRERLTPREREVLAAASSGKTNADIGMTLGISTRTVQKHLENIFRKIAVHRRTAAAAAFLRDRHAARHEA